MAKHLTSIPPAAQIKDEEGFLEPVQQLTRRNDGDATYRAETDDGSALLTDLQRAALRWLASLD
jgi:hypothetical protein